MPKVSELSDVLKRLDIEPPECAKGFELKIDNIPLGVFKRLKLLDNKKADDSFAEDPETGRIYRIRDSYTIMGEVCILKIAPTEYRSKTESDRVHL